MGFQSSQILALKSNRHPCGALHIIMFPVWLWNCRLKHPGHLSRTALLIEAGQVQPSHANGINLSNRCSQWRGSMSAKLSSFTFWLGISNCQPQAMQLSMLRLWNRCCVMRSKPKALDRNEFWWSTQRERGNANSTSSLPSYGRWNQRIFAAGVGQQHSFAWPVVVFMTHERHSLSSTDKVLKCSVKSLTSDWSDRHPILWNLSSCLSLSAQ